MVLSFYIQPIVENENRINDGNFKQKFSSFPPQIWLSFNFSFQKSIA